MPASATDRTLIDLHVPQARRPAALGFAAATLAMLTLGGAPASAQVPAEILVAVDTSESMQFVAGANTAPDCAASMPARSRWALALEMLLGGHGSYACAEQALADHPDSVSPPKQQFGPRTCIGGASYVASDEHPLPADAQELQAIGDRSFAGQAPSIGSELRIETSPGDVVLPFFVMDITKVPTTEAWVGGSVTLTTKNGSGAGGQDRWLVLVAAEAPPSAMPTKEWMCKYASSKRLVVSAPTKLATTPGSKTTFALTADYAKALRVARDSGAKAMFLAVMPAANWIADDCSGRSGDTATNFYTMFYGPLAATGDRPRVALAAGVVCQREGPGKHYAPVGARAGEALLPSFVAVARFGLIVADSVLGAADDGAGGFSFGPTIATVWGDANLGMADPRKATAPSIPPPDQDTLAQRQATNAKIAASLEALQPRGGTPLGRLLEDVRLWTTSGAWQDPHFMKAADHPQGDPYQECRQRYLVLFTDGVSNLDDGTADGRQLAINTAAALHAAGTTVVVVSVADDGATSPPAWLEESRAFLDELAAAGGSDAAWRVQTPTDLVKRFNALLGASVIKGEVRTRTVWSEATGNKQDVQHTFHARSQFDPVAPMNTAGTFEQRIWSCTKQCVSQTDPSAGRVCSVIDYHTRLANRGVARSIYAMVGGARIDFDSNAIGVDALELPTVGTAPKLRLDNTGTCVSESVAYDLTQPLDRAAFRDDIIGWARSTSGSCREGRPLGAPAEGQMAVLEPAGRLPVPDAIFKTYATTATPSAAGFTTSNPTGSLRRPTMLFAPTHLGLLHAFRTDRDAQISVEGSLEAGDEMWAWIPGFVLRRMRELPQVKEAAASFLGGDVVATHALLERKVSTAAEQALQWRAVVLGSAGEAGAGYFALDVTAPMRPRLLWEITPDRHCWGPDVTLNGVSGPLCALSTNFQGMGRSTARPVLARAFYEVNSQPVERTVVLIAGGKPSSASSVANFGVDGTGARAIYVVELASGRLVRAFTEADLDLTGVTTTVGAKSELGHFWTAPTCYNVAPGALVSRCFVGDSKGMIWRLDLTARDPAEWKIQFFHDAYSGDDTPSAWVKPISSPDRAPYRSPPSLALARGGDLVLVAGTGSADDSPSASRRHLVYSLRETFALSASGSAAAAKPVRNWVYAHDGSTKFLGPPLIFSGNAYWATYSASTSGLCSVGVGRLWGADYLKPKSASDPTTLFGAFPNPAAPAKPSANLTDVILGAFQPSPVEVTPVPTCQGGCALSDVNCVATKGGALAAKKPGFQLSVGAATSNQGKGQTPATGTAPAVGTATQGLAPPRSTAVITGWDLLYD